MEQTALRVDVVVLDDALLREIGISANPRDWCAEDFWRALATKDAVQIKTVGPHMGI